MADFEVVGTHWTVKVNDGHFSETYEIDAPGQAAAVAEARQRWAKRAGPRGDAVYGRALAAGHEPPAVARAPLAPAEIEQRNRALMSAQSAGAMPATQGVHTAVQAHADASADTE